MEITVAGDVVIDVATKADLAEHHDRLRTMMERPHGHIRRPIASGATGAGFAGSGPVYLLFEPASPPAGRIWMVQYVSVWVGLTPSAGATANLFATFAVGNAPRGSQSDILVAGPAINIGDIVAPGLVVPTGASGDMPDRVIVQSEDQAYVILQGSALAASTRYSATMGVLDLPDTPEALLWA